MSREQWNAAVVLVAGIIQRSESPNSENMRIALQQVSAGNLVQIEYMMIFSAVQTLYRAGVPLTHEKILEAVQELEPGRKFGFACVVFEKIWERKAESLVGDEDFTMAVAQLLGPRVKKPEEEETLEATKPIAWWQIWK